MHHFPSPVDVDDAEGEPEDQSHSGEGVNDGLGIRVGDFPSCVEESNADEEGAEKEEEVGLSEMREVESSRRAIRNGTRFGSGVGIFVTQIRGGLLRGCSLFFRSWDEA